MVGLENLLKADWTSYKASMLDSEREVRKGKSNQLLTEGQTKCSPENGLPSPPVTHPWHYFSHWCEQMEDMKPCQRGKFIVALGPGGYSLLWQAGEMRRQVGGS